MKKLLVVSGLVGSLLFTGCASSGIGMNPGSSSIKQTFDVGTVVSSKKVLIDEGHLGAVGTGAAVGAGAGALLGSRSSGQHALTGGLIGAAVGAGAGLIASTVSGGNEVEAYEIEIRDNTNPNRYYRTYVKYDLPPETIVEFILRSDGTLTNVDVKRAGKRVN